MCFITFRASPRLTSKPKGTPLIFFITLNRLSGPLPESLALAGHACGDELGFIHAKPINIKLKDHAAAVALDPAFGLLTGPNQPTPSLPYPFQLLFFPFRICEALSRSSLGNVGDMGAIFSRPLPVSVLAFSAVVAGACSPPWTHLKY